MASEVQQSGKANGELVSALAGLEAERNCQAASRARQVVGASLGVLREQQAGGRRRRSLALAAVVVVGLLLGPLAWQAADVFFEEEALAGQIGQLTVVLFLTAVVLASAVLAATVLAGWVRRRP